MDKASFIIKEANVVSRGLRYLSSPSYRSRLSQLKDLSAPFENLAAKSGDPFLHRMSKEMRNAGDTLTQHTKATGMNAPFDFKQDLELLRQLNPDLAGDLAHVLKQQARRGAATLKGTSQVGEQLKDYGKGAAGILAKLGLLYGGVEGAKWWMNRDKTPKENYDALGSMYAHMPDAANYNQYGAY